MQGIEVGRGEHFVPAEGSYLDREGRAQPVLGFHYRLYLDRLLAAVVTMLPGSRRVIYDRGWAENTFMMIQSNPLDYPSSEVVFEWGTKRPWSQVESFGAR